MSETNKPLRRLSDGLQIFENERFGKVRVVMRDSEPWFVAKDVCDCLKLGNVSQALDGLDGDEKQQLETNIINPDVGGRGTLIISEKGSNPFATLGGAHQLTTQGVDTIRTLNDSNGLRVVK